jgi:antitoxin (DNA-binding transcriptional repressor) of toxin-antitoxin stability system
VQQNFGAAIERVLRGDDVIIERYGTPRAVLVEYGRHQQLVALERERA